MCDTPIARITGFLYSRTFVLFSFSFVLFSFSFVSFSSLLCLCLCFCFHDQGDVKFAEVLEKMGATLTWEANAMTVTRDMATPLKGVDVDCGEIPDAAMTLAVSLIH